MYSSYDAARKGAARPGPYDPAHQHGYDSQIAALQQENARLRDENHRLRSQPIGAARALLAGVGIEAEVETEQLYSVLMTRPRPADVLVGEPYQSAVMYLGVERAESYLLALTQGPAAGGAWDRCPGVLRAAWHQHFRLQRRGVVTCEKGLETATTWAVRRALGVDGDDSPDWSGWISVTGGLFACRGRPGGPPRPLVANTLTVNRRHDLRECLDCGKLFHGGGSAACPGRVGIEAIDLGASVPEPAGAQLAYSYIERNPGISKLENVKT